MMKKIIYYSMANTCWEYFDKDECYYCVYRQLRFKNGFATECWTWHKEQNQQKPCETCEYYIAKNSQQQDKA